MSLFQLPERIYVHVLAFFSRRLSFLMTYRFALLLYPLHSPFFSGFYLVKKYLHKKYGLKIKLWSKSLIEHRVLFTGMYEKSTNKVLEKYIAAGDVVLEAGANVGTETLLLSRLVGDQGRIYAFEPVPALKSRLEENCALNGLANVSIEQLALGETSGVISFFIADEGFTNQGMGSKKPVNQHLKNEISVKQVTLDEYCKKQGIRSLDLIKMDIQGAELDLLQGGDETIRLYRPAIFLEAGEGWSSLEDLYAWLNSRNYDVYSVLKDASLSIISIDDLSSGVWLAQPRDAESLLLKQDRIQA